MWWIIAIVIVLIILAFLKFEHFKRTWNILLLAVIVAVIYFSMTAMIKSNQMDFSSPKATINSIAIYAGWLGETSLNLISVGKDAVVILGNAIKGNMTSTT